MSNAIEVIPCYTNSNSNMLMNARVLHIEKDAPTCIYLLGALQDIGTISLFTEELSKHYNYLAVEVPGTGNTPPLDPKYSFDFIAECLNQVLLKKVGPEPIRIVACSYGTATAVAFAKKYPERVSQIALAGSMYDIPKTYWPTMFDLMHRAYSEQDSFADGFIDLLTTPIPAIKERQDTIRRAAVRKAKRFQSEHFEHFIFNTVRLMSYDPGSFEQIKAPALVVTGEFDPYCTIESAKKLAEKFPNGMFKPITDCDHLFHIEDPQQLIDRVMLFFAQYRDESSATNNGNGFQDVVNELSCA